MRMRALLVFALSAGCAGDPAPREDTPGLERLSERGLFRVRASPVPGSVPLDQLHSWVVEVTDPEGAPVDDLRIEVEGGMPAHGHGLPTQPRVGAGAGPGELRLDGVRFNMPGEWVLLLHLRSSAATDTVAVRLTLP